MKTHQLDQYITQVILKPQHRYYNIEGAPFNIGDKVIVLNNPADDTLNKKFIGKKGEVSFFEYDCGCGQTFPNDPMIGVKFDNGRSGEFWKEELQTAV